MSQDSSEATARLERMFGRPADEREDAVDVARDGDAVRTGPRRWSGRANPSATPAGRLGAMARWPADARSGALTSRRPNLVAGQRPTNGRTVTTGSGGYAFDVTDLAVVMRMSTDVFVGRVTAVTAIDDGAGTTTFRVEPDDLIKGGNSRGKVVEIRPTGYVDTSGTTHVLAGQQLLQPGNEYLLVTTYQSGQPLILMAGPLAVRLVTDPADREQFIERYRAAVP